MKLIQILNFANAVNTFNASLAYPVCSLDYTEAAIKTCSGRFQKTQKNMLNIYILTLVRAYIDQRYTLEQHDYKPAQVKNRNQMKGQDPEHLHICRLNTLI